MILETIDSPADLKSLDSDQLEILAAEIRQFIVDSVNQVGHGHLGSNLGVVELTLALHRVFDSPRDIILWDTGHQAYVHKIITGRRSQFATLRQAGGLSGYPSRAESEHDWIENSHASTILSYAHGLATAQQSEGGEGRRVIAVIGDGSMTGGMAFEGLNNLGHSGRDCIIILNDNGRSYAPTISRLGESLVKIRNNPTYMRRQARIEKLLAEMPLVGDRLERAMEATKAAIREMWEPPAFFEALGVRYAGPFDGHDIAGLEEALRNAAEIGGPQVIHVHTQKGRGYAPAENDPIKRLHDIGGAKPGSYTAAFTEALLKEAEEHPEIVAITAAMPDSTGLLPFAERYPDRFFDVGIAEQHAVTAAAGMAMGGLRPVVAIYSTFLTRAFDQINLDVGLHHQPVVFCIDRAGITGDDGASHHGLLDMVLLTKVPGMTMFAPSSYQELQVMLHDALEITSGPVAIRWPKTMARQANPDEVGHGLRGRKLRSGSELCIVAVGKMLDAAEAAAELLEAEGVSTTVWDARVVTPLDPELIADAARHPFVVTVEDGLRDGGVGAAIADRIAQVTLGRPAPRVRVLGVPAAYIPHGKPDAILADLGLDGPGVAASARELLATAGSLSAERH
ncbi:1-deoxy-D-xylulose-5-phosphate synthase [Rhabdothermincola sediminis]|uniref:1-deoxy-D-xylulose-5-phosphate synthase n=1 Tax=Rhabdothermincola sediminis TaxID=2751370 RepID=UPI001AA059F9|nr:1-deoxy-D-xylulose-5-phosphate synthase [Rhabdothermincola sediminis]